MVAGHGGCGGPGEVIVESAAEALVAVEAGIRERLIKAGDGALVHLFMHAIAAMNADDGSLIAIAAGVKRWTAEGFGPIGGKAFGVLRMKAVAEGMGDDFVFENAFVPGVGEFQHAVETARGVVEG